MLERKVSNNLDASVVFVQTFEKTFDCTWEKFSDRSLSERTTRPHRLLLGIHRINRPNICRISSLIYFSLWAFHFLNLSYKLISEYVFSPLSDSFSFD